MALPLLSACAPDEPETSKEPDSVSKEYSNPGSEFLNGAVIKIDSKSIDYYSSSNSQINWDVETGDTQKVYTYNSAKEHRPNGYSKYIGPVLAIMIDQFKDNADKKYPVIIGALQADETSADFIERTAGIQANDVVSLYIDDIRADGTKSAYYAELTADQIKALAASKLECLYVGNAWYKAPIDAWWETQDSIEAFCNHYGDMFVFGTDSKIVWALQFVIA